jgi:hypothetical protein
VARRPGPAIGSGGPARRRHPAIADRCGRIATCRRSFIDQAALEIEGSRPQFEVALKGSRTRLTSAPHGRHGDVRRSRLGLARRTTIVAPLDGDPRQTLREVRADPAPRGWRTPVGTGAWPQLGGDGGAEEPDEAPA